MVPRVAYRKKTKQMSVDGTRHISFVKTVARIGVQAYERAEAQELRSPLVRMFVSAFARAEGVDSWDF
jgi:hypothetical protein